MDEYDNQFLDAVFLSLLPFDAEEKNLKLIVTRTEKCLLKQWPGASLKLYGSYGAGISLNTSDIDSTLMVDVGKKRLPSSQRFLKKTIL